MLLQRGHLPGDHRARHAHLLGDSAKLPSSANPHKQAHGGKAIHCCQSGNSDFWIVGYFASKEVYSSPIDNIYTPPPKARPDDAPCPVCFVPHGAPTFALAPGAAGAGAA